MNERFKKAPLSHKIFGAVTTAALTACQVGEKIGFVYPTPEGTKTPPTETVPPNNFPIATVATEVSSYGQYEFIEQSEIETNLKEPYEHFKNNPDIKALFNDPNTVEYSAMGIRVYLQGGGHTNYIFFEGSSETEEKGYIAMVFGGEQPGEISYSVLNRIVDSNGIVGLGLTSDIGGNRLENPVMIFNTGLTEKEISQLTADDLLKRDILFIPGGIKVPSERIIGAKALFSLAPTEPTPAETPAPMPEGLPEGYAVEVYIYRGEATQVIKNSQDRIIYVLQQEDWEKVSGGMLIENKDWVDNINLIDQVLEGCRAEARARFGDVKNFKPAGGELLPSVGYSKWGQGIDLMGTYRANRHLLYKGDFYIEGFVSVGTGNDRVICSTMVYVDKNRTPYRLFGWVGEVHEGKVLGKIPSEFELSPTEEIEELDYHEHSILKIMQQENRLKGLEYIFMFPVLMDDDLKYLGGAGLHVKQVSDLFWTIRQSPEYYKTYQSFWKKIDGGLPLSESEEVLLPVFKILTIWKYGVANDLHRK